MLDLKTIVLTIGITAIVVEELDPNVTFLKYLKNHYYFKYFYVYAYAQNTFGDTQVSMLSVLIAYLIIHRKTIMKGLKRKLKSYKQN